MTKKKTCFVVMGFGWKADLRTEGWMIDSTREQRAKLEDLLTDSPLKYIKADSE